MKLLSQETFILFVCFCLPPKAHESVTFYYQLVGHNLEFTQPEAKVKGLDGIGSVVREITNQEVLVKKVNKNA